MNDGSLKRDQLLRELQRTAVAQRKQFAPIERTVRDESSPLSFAQQRLWFIDQLEGSGTAYHVRLAMRLRGSLDVEALRQALDAVVDRHETLRTTFAQVNGDVRQVIAPTARFALQETDLGAYDTREQDAQITRHIAEESAQRFDLGAGPLFRGRLLRVSAEERVLLLTMHHIVSDGWSAGILLSEIAALYGACMEGRPNPLAALPIQYADFAAWQRKWLQGEVLQEQLDYWKQQLAGAPVLLELPTDRPRPTVQSSRGGNLAFRLGAELTEQVKDLSKQHNATLLMTMYAALALVMSRLSGQEDVVIGVPVANRRRTELEGLIGFFVNMLPLRVAVHASDTLGELLNRVRGLMLKAYAYQEIPFEQVVEALQPPRSLSHSPIFQISLSWQNAPLAASAKQWLPGIETTPLAVPGSTSKFDLSWALQETNGEITGSVQYASELFDRETIERWIGHFQHVLAEMARDARRPAGGISLLDAVQRDQVLREFNATDAPLPRDKVVHELFEAQARHRPNAPAVEYGNQYLTYQDLNQRSNQLAHHLRRYGVGPDQLVALYVERGLDMIVAMLGVLKAGAAYVPLEPGQPKERLEYMLADTAPRVLLTLAHLEKQRPEFTGPCIVLDSEWAQVEDESRDDLDPARVGVTPKSLAYVIYTSGSTGKPKGVMVEHANLLNLVAWHVRAFDVVEGNRSSCAAGLGFDACTWEVWPPLCAGACLLLPEERITKNPEALLKWWCDQPLDQSFLATPLAEFALTRGLRNSHLRTLLVGGDCLRYRPGEGDTFSLVNNYGPTECAVVATSGAIQGPEPVLHIGRPIANARIYILDAQGQPVPIGVAGEIHIGGAGVARGYLNNPQLTEEKFLKDPFSADAEARMYRTGDVGRWLRDGNIEYLGRADGQVKIRGYRIELGEIEARLLEHEQVREVAVVAREEPGREKRLVAYVTLTGQPTARELREFLRSRIPEYMVPGAYMVLESLPMTANGKVDRRALPAPEHHSMPMREYEAPQGELEEALAGIWRELLHVQQVGRQDNFFELGGHSLLVMQLLERMRRIGLRGTVLNVFEHPTLSDLVSAVSGAAQVFGDAPANLIDEAEVITPELLTMIELTQEQIDRIVAMVPGGARNVQDIYPLAPFQEGVLFHHLMNEHADAYIFSSLLEMGSRRELDELVKGLQAVIDRHDLLRSAVLWDGLPRPVQVVYRQASLQVEEIHLEQLDDPLTELQTRLTSQRLWMDVREAPLIRLQIARAADGVRWYALLLQHHLINDHVGQEILLQELMAQLENRGGQLSQPVAYRNFVWQTLTQTDGGEAETFFRGKLGDVTEPTAPFGLLDVHGDGREIRQARQRVEPELSFRLRSQARRLGVSAATLFHTAWALVVARTSSQDDVVFGSVLLGRMRGWRDIDRAMGMFINTLPLRIKLKGQSAEQLVRHVQREIVELLQHEQTSLAVAQRCSSIAGSRPLFSAVLNYRHSSPGRSAVLEEKGMRVLEAQERSNYPLLIAVSDLGESFDVVAQTDPRVDPQRVAGYLHEALASVVDALESAPSSPALELNILPQAERRQILDEFGATAVRYPNERLVHELFEAQVRKAPDACAVVCEGQRLTYGELNRRSNQLAHHLRRQGIGADVPVAVYVERGPDMIVGLLGILKAGGAYLPIDLNSPRTQVEYMLRDAAPQVLLTQQSLIDRFPDFAGTRIALDSDWNEIGKQEDGNLDAASVGIGPANLAYVIYTSGSTGTPKGVAAPHGGLVNRLAAQAHFAAFADGDVCCHKTAVGFVDSIAEALGPLTYGLPLVVATATVARDADALAGLIERESVTWLITVPSLARSLVDTPENIQRLVTVRHWTLSGEPLTPALLRQLQASLPECRFVNLYGSSEVAADATFYVSRRFAGDRVPIGRPLPNTRVYLLDERGEPVPMGIAGEIHVGGIAVARGYLNKPQLTAERFVKDPFAADADARMYKTGDLGRWLSDGNIECLGRNDSQIKIRGYRIELGGIEAQLALHEHVGAAAVICREDDDGQKRLVAYVTLKKATGARELREFLAGRLPEYMVPSGYEVLDSLPMTPNGKVDRRALAATKTTVLALREYQAPQGDEEQALAGIWRELLRVEQVGRHDDFFELGGNSLLVLRLVMRIRSRYDVKLALPQIFARPTLAGVAGLIGEALADVKRYEAVEMGRSNVAFDRGEHEEMLL
ncbi:MAG TPA: amino acid adenylation domain-containing protein [Steroidobacteraceae bacterium]|nr:amino acid adenylation domain-containing protein [Steroidobacteraceae bacterium]